jgi:hypothetical protein
MKNFHCARKERIRTYNAKQILIKVENGFRVLAVDHGLGVSLPTTRLNIQNQLNIFDVHVGRVRERVSGTTIQTYPIQHTCMCYSMCV